MTNQEINEAVARKLGWLKDYEGFWVRGEKYMESLPDYCTSIAAAWEVVEKWDTVQFERTNDRQWILVVDRNEIAAEYADTAPMAIALAFLKLPF